MRARNISGALTLAVCCLMVAGCAQPQKKLQSMKRFNSDRLIVGVWVWQDRFAKGQKYDRDIYFRELSKAGFNTFLGGELDLPYLEKYDLHMMYGVWKAHLPQLIEHVDKNGAHPRIIGYHLNDNCSLHGYTIDCAKWLEKEHPGMIPWMSTNPDPIGQSRVPMPVISSQTYPFSYGAGRPSVQNRSAYANMCEGDRAVANRYGLTVWTIMGIFSHTQTPAEYRFQANAGIAYGAKGVWVFAYNRYFRPVLNRAAGPVNRYLTDVVGPRILGHRSVRVFHSGPDLPGGHEKPGKDKLIKKMDDHLLAGVFVPDDKFQAGVDAPEYLMVVDKRTVNFSQQGKIASWTGGHSDGELPRPKSFTDAVNRMYDVEDPKPRVTRISLGKRVRRVDALLRDGTVERLKMDAAGAVALPALRGGAAVLLRIKVAPIKIDTKSADIAVWTVPNKWKFSMDTKNVAEKEGWAAPSFDDSKWKEIFTDRHAGWASQGYGRYCGTGWYRLNVTIPPKFIQQYRYLYFGAADEESWTYIDGQLAFAHSRQSTGLGFSELWTRPFFFECSKLLKPGKEHVIAVRVFNNWGSGGLYRPIRLVGSSKKLSREQLWKVLREQETPKGSEK